MPKVIIEIGKGANADQILASLKAQLGGVADSVSLVSENTRRLEREQRQAERSFRATAAALDPAIAKAQEYSKSQAALGEALKRNIITQQEHDRLLALAKERHDEGSNSLLNYIGKYGTGATAIAAFTAALSGSLVVLEQVQAFVSSSISSAADSERVQAQIDARIASTGGAAELTASQLADMANELQNLSKFDDESLAGAQNVLLTFTSIKGDTFREALSAVTDMSTALGTDLATNARLVGKALEDPVKGLSALSKAGVVFTTGQRDVIQSLVESGDLLGAQDEILAALSERYGGAAAADVATFGGSIDRLNNLWDNFQEKVGEGVLPVLSTFLEQVGNVILGNDELAASLGRWVEEGGRALAVLVSGAADAASSWLGMAASVQGGMASIVEAAADGAEALGAFFHVDNSMLVDGLREAAKGQRENAAVSQALADAAADVSDAAFLAAINLGKEGDAAKTGAKHSSDHAIADAEAAKEAEAFAKSLRAVLDELDPIGKAERQAAEQIVILNRALAEGMPVRDYQAAVAALTQKLNDARAAALGLTDAVKLEILELPSRLASIEQLPAVSIPATLTLESGGTEFDREAAAASERFSQNMESGLLSAGETFFAEFMSGGDDAWEHLGENLTQVMIQSVAEWLTAQLAAIAKAAAAAAAVKLGGGGGTPYGPTPSGGNLAGGGMSAGVGWAAAFGAVLVGIYAIMKHQDDRAHATSYGTAARVNFDNGRLTASFVGELRETGAAISNGLADVLSQLQSATGLWIQGTQSAEIAIRNDKQGFYLKINDAIVGEFTTVREAMLAAVKHMFTDGQLSGVLDERIQDVINSFQGDDPAKLIENVQAVKQIIDGVSGFSDVQLAIQDLPGYIAQTEARLRSMGLSIQDAGELSAQAGAQMRQSIRDQITGHQQTAAEQMAQKQREAAMFNAQLLMDRAQIAADLEVLKAKLEIAQGANQIANADIQMQATYLSAKADLIDDEFRIENGRLVGIAAFNQASAALLAQQIAALETAQGYLNGIELIRPEEIHLNRGGGGGGGNLGNIDSGPTEAEQRIQSFLDFLENARLAGLTEYQRRFEELDRTFAEQRATLDEMIAASDGSAESLATLAEQEAALAAARIEQAAALREEIIDGLGLPLEAVRDRVAEIQDQVDAWFQSGQDLVDQYQRGEIGQDELMRKLEEANQLWGEFGSMAQAELQNLALYFTDAMGDTEESARIRAELAEMEWDFKRAELRMLAEAYHAANVLNDEEYQRWVDFIDNLPDNRPAETPAPPPPPPDTNNGQDEALQAQRDLISALEDLADLQRDLWASDLSPLNAEQQTQFLAGQLQDAFNQAQASGSAEDVRAFQDLVRQYLSSYQDAYGSTGGYTAEFLRINSLINSLLAMGNIGGVVPGPGMLGGTGGTGSGGWRPTPGANGNVLPFERTGGPGSPLVVESPALNAIATLAAETNRRLAALETRIGGLHGAVQDGNERIAGRLFTAGRTDQPSTVSGRPRIQRRGA